jgi:hypothetical protein
MIKQCPVSSLLTRLSASVGAVPLWGIPACRHRAAIKDFGVEAAWAVTKRTSGFSEFACFSHLSMNSSTTNVLPIPDGPYSRASARRSSASDSFSRIRFAVRVEMNSGLLARASALSSFRK